MSTLTLNSHFAAPEENDRFGRFLEFLVSRGRTEATARSYRSDWQDLSLWYRRARGAPFDGRTLDSPTLQAWREAGAARGKSPATLTRRLAFARSYGRWLASEGVLEGRLETASQSLDSGGGAEDRSVRVLDDSEVHRLLRQVDQRGCPRDQAILYVLLDTGLKVGELVSLELGDVDFATGRLRLNTPWERTVELPTRTARKVAYCLAERGLLTVPEGGELELPPTGGWPPATRVATPSAGRLPAVKAPLSPMPDGMEGPPERWPLFAGERGRLTSNAVQRIVRKHADFARLAEASPHVLRHTWALAYWLRTHDLVGLAERLGLASLDSARAYALMEAAGEGVGESEALAAVG